MFCPWWWCQSFVENCYTYSLRIPIDNWIWLHEQVIQFPISSIVSTGITAKPQDNTVDSPKEVVLKRVAEMMKGKMDISNLLSRAPSGEFNRYLIKLSSLNVDMLVKFWSHMLIVDNALHYLSNVPSYFILRKITTVIVIIQSAAMDLMTKSLTRKQKNSFSFLV